MTEGNGTWREPDALTLYIEIDVARDRVSDKGKVSGDGVTSWPWSKGKSKLKPERHKGKVKGTCHVPYLGVKIGLKSYIIILRY